jgi:hypothetical protein
MTNAARTTRRNLLLALTMALLVSGTVAAPASAATTTPFAARFDETTTPVACPPGTPPEFVCFSGTGVGEAIPPGGRARESFQTLVGPVDPTNPCANDRSLARIDTSVGSLSLIARGQTCFDTGIGRGTWTVVGGTGRFAGARGSGTFRTVVKSMGPPIESETTYTGTLTF